MDALTLLVAFLGGLHIIIALLLIVLLYQAIQTVSRVQRILDKIDQFQAFLFSREHLLGRVLAFVRSRM